MRVKFLVRLRFRVTVKFLVRLRFRVTVILLDRIRYIFTGRIKYILRFSIEGWQAVLCMGMR